MSQCKAHLYSNMTGWFAPFTARLSYIEYHSQSVQLLIQYVCQPTAISRTNQFHEEIQDIHLKILHAFDSGGILAVMDTFDHIKDHLEVSQTVLYI